MINGKLQLLKKVILLYRRERFLKKANNEYIYLRADYKAWKQLEEEVGEWDILLDERLGLEDE